MRIEDIKSGSAEDMFLRGYNREDVLEATGEDIGYHGSKYRAKVKGIDRLEYRKKYILNNYTKADILFVLDGYGSAKMTKADIFEYFGLAYYNDNAMKLSDIFTALGYQDEFDSADYNYRQMNLSNLSVKKSEKSNSSKKVSKSSLKSKKREAEMLKKQALRQKKLEEKAKREEEKRKAQEEKKRLEEEKRLRQQKIRKWHLDEIDETLEDFIFERLAYYYGYSDISRDVELVDDMFVSFYVKSRDLYIDCNGSSIHGFHWFNKDSELDQNKLSEMNDISLLSSNEIQQFIEVWTRKDVEKRDYLSKCNLNYVSFWDGKNFEDAKLWFGMDMPDGKDYLREYSWLPDKDLSSWQWEWPELKKGINIAINAARAMNGHEFYKREIALWNENPYYDNKWGNLQARLYANRFKYQNSGTHKEDNQYYRGKLPDEINELELLRGFGISSVLNAYTVFNNSLMSEVIEKYDIKSIYDPCAGWGERGFTAAVMGVSYFGVDINPKVVDGGRKMIGHYNLPRDKYSYICSDSSKYNVQNRMHDAVISCPPYFDTEHYTDEDGAAENMTEEEFLLWWDTVVKISVSPSTRVFAFQINQEWKERLSQIVLDNGWIFSEELTLTKQVSHKNRKQDGEGFKKEYESMMVFVRK